MTAKEKKEREDFEREWHERRAQERHAWGSYAAYQRQSRLDQQLEEADSEAERNAILARARAENQRGFYVG